MTPMSARSRRPMRVSVGMLSSNWRACSAVSTGVLPRRTTCFGPRTACAGLVATIWPVTSQSKHMGSYRHRDERSHDQAQKVVRNALRGGIIRSSHPSYLRLQPCADMSQAHADGGQVLLDRGLL